MKDYYKILQISPDAAPEVIQMAYKALAKKYHPDLNPDNAEQAQEQMKELNAAFEVLSNPEKRARYDAEQKSAESASASTASQTQADTSTQKPPEHKSSQHSSPEKEKTPPSPKATESTSDSSKTSSSQSNAHSFGFMDFLDIFLSIVLIFFVGRFAIKFFKSIDSDTSSHTNTSQSVEDTTEQPQADSINYTWEQFSDFGSTYSFSENPYYVDGISRYVDMVNTFYSSLKTSSSKQDVSQTTLEQAMKDAGVSHSLIKKLLSKQGADILQDSDFYRMDEKSDTGLVTSLFDSDRERAYLEVSSTAKDAISSDDAILFYFGDLKDNKPDGNGAIFSYSQATGLSFGYSGQFKEGKMSGKGITFSHYRFGYSLAESGEYEKNQLNGSGTQYRYDDSTIIYQFYQDKFAEYSNTVLSAKSEEEKKKLFEHILEKNPAVELFLTASSYDFNRTTIDFNEAVICPYIEYKGNFKYDRYDGKGKFYAPGGWLAYDGAWGNEKYNGKGTLYNDDGSERKKGDFKYEEISDDLILVTLSYALSASYDSFSLDELFATDASELASSVNPNDIPAESDSLSTEIIASESSSTFSDTNVTSVPVVDADSPASTATTIFKPPYEIAGHYWNDKANSDAYISIYSSPDGNKVGNIDIPSNGFSGTICFNATDYYDVIANDGETWNLAIGRYFDGRIGFSLYADLPSGEFKSLGDYDMTEHYSS